MRKLVLVFVFLSFFSLSFSKEIPFTQEDRDRLIRVGVKVKALNKRMDILQKHIDDLRTLILWDFGVLFGDMGILTGLVMWDRRSAISPVVKKTRERMFLGVCSG
ncbi:MAG: hypothetical protein ACK4SM_06415 [Aquificaceae bacterium]